MTNSTYRRLIPLIMLAALALFPIGWLALINPIAAQLDDFFFATDLSHAIAHAAIFLVVSVAAMLAFPALRQRPWWFALLMLGLAIGQEGFQLLYKQRGIGFDEFRDVGTDAVGFVLALVLARFTHFQGRS